MFDGSWWTISNDGFLIVNFCVVSSLLIILTQYLQFIHIIHVNHRLIICLLNLFIKLNTASVLSVTLVQNFGILYLLMLRKSSRFPVFVNTSRILWLMVIILLLIPNVLRLYYLNYYLINEVILFIWNKYFASIFLLLIFLFGSPTRFVPRTI